ncbi:anti-sigma factor family protein [Candidatus Latescibacterota bacterium]
MNCQNAHIKAALYAGGDLPERDIPGLLKHLESCGDCAAEFESLKQSRNTVRKIAQTDIPEPLPADFSQSVMGRIYEGNKRSFGFSEIFRFRSVAVFAAAAIVVIAYLGVSHILLQRKVQRFARQLEEVQQIIQRDRSEVRLDSGFLSTQEIEGPFQLGEWELPDTPGLFAVLHKPDPVNEPDTFVIDYLGDTLGSDIGYASWIDLNREHFLARAGSDDNIYVAVYQMPGSSESYRMRIAGFFINKHKPYFNDGV